MHLGDSVRRLSAPAAALLSAAAVCIACSSSTSGSPDTSGGASIGSASLPGVPSVSIPSISLPSGLPTGLTGLPSISGLPSLGGDQANSAFCKDFQSFDPSSVLGDPGSAAGVFDKIADDAPDAIKDDAELVRDFINSAVSGNPDTSKLQGYTQAITNLTSYYAAHCAG